MHIFQKSLIGLGVLVLAAVAAGQAGLLRGSAPTDLGVRDGRLKPPAATPNSVSSQAGLYPGQAAAMIEPLPAAGDATAAMARLELLVKAMPGAEVVRSEPGYLYAQFTTRLMKYVDDAEFWYDPAARVIQVRSASRLGQSDMGANRARIEALRAKLSAG